MTGILTTLFAICLGASPAGNAPTPPHPIDRPLADVTIVPKAEHVEMELLMNFKFLDAVLGTKAPETIVPTRTEAETTHRRLLELLAKSARMTIDGQRHAGVAGRLEFAPPQAVVLEREPQLARPLSQIRFTLTFPFPSAKTLEMHWPHYPEHALYDVPNSPIAPVTVNAVLVRGEAADARKFTKEEPVLTFDLKPADTKPAAPGGAAAPKPSNWLMWTLLAAAAPLAYFGLRRMRGAAAGCVCAALALSACSDPAPSVRQPATVTTKSYSVQIQTTPSQVPTNEHFTVEVTIQHRHGGQLPDQVVIDADMPAHKHGMNTKPRLTDLGGGRYRAEGMLFHMPGRWELYVYIGKDAAMERAALPIEL